MTGSLIPVVNSVESLKCHVTYPHHNQVVYRKFLQGTLTCTLDEGKLIRFLCSAQILLCQPNDVRRGPLSSLMAL